MAEHALACTANTLQNGYTWAHNEFTRDMANISHYSGCGGRYHDGPIFPIGNKLRPADGLEDDPQHPAGRANDNTGGIRGVATADSRECVKRAKYGPLIALHKHLGFRAFGYDSAGVIGEDAYATICNWSRSLATLRTSHGEVVGDPRSEITTAVGRAFTRWLGQRVLGWSRGREATRTGPRRGRGFTCHVPTVSAPAETRRREAVGQRLRE